MGLEALALRHGAWGTGLEARGATTPKRRKNSFRGNDYTGIKEDKPFGGSVHGSCGVVLTNKLVKALKTHSKIPETPFLQSP